jgi:DNA polymerase-1
MADRLVLIDGASYLFRAYYAIKSLSTSKGVPTNAIYGFTQMLLKVLRDHRSAHVAVVFDLPGPTFRDAIYPAYKANRPPSPPDLIAQIPRVKEITRAMGIPILEVEGVEADDVIGTLARRADAEGLPCVIITGDKDLMQLVTGTVTILDTMKDLTIGVEEVKKRFGVGPGQVVDILALAGDATDNIPGVDGIGEVTAAKLVAEHGSLEAVLGAGDRIRQPKLRERLLAGAASARLSRTLATIKTDVPLDRGPRDLRPSPPDSGRLRALFTELEFGKLLKDLAPAKTVPYDAYRLVMDRAGLEELLRRLRAAPVFAIDTETTARDPMRASLVGISFAVAPGEAWYVPVGHVSGSGTPAEGGAPGLGTAAPNPVETQGDLFAPAPPPPRTPQAPAAPPVQLPRDLVLETLRPLLESETPGKIGQNIKYDLIVLERHGVRLRGIAGDSMLASYVLNPSKTSHGLEALAREFLGHQLITYEEVTGRGKEAVTFDRVPLETAKVYSCEDADVTLRIHGRLAPELRAQGLWDLYADVERPLLVILAALERTGVRVDRAALDALKAEFGTRIEALVGEMHALAGEPFNPDSPKQLQHILFEKLGLERGRRIKTGHSTDGEVLARLAAGHPIAEKLLTYRGLSKLRSTYAEALAGLIHPETGRIHTSYNQTVTATGRLSSSEPNLQNIPVRTPEGRLIRKAFVPEPGWVFVSADYSQIELRVLAHLSGDPTLREAFRRNEDIHARTAAELFGGGAVEADPELRRRAKVVNFGILYGMSDHGLATQLGIPHGEARDIIERYFARYAAVKGYLDGVVAEARKTGYVTTLLKRRRYLSDLDSPQPNLRGFAERMAINTPIQGSAADLIKLAMIRAARRLERERLRTRLILQVHDELVAEAPTEEADRAKAALREEMEGAFPLEVPLQVEVSSGPNWAELT